MLTWRIFMRDRHIKGLGWQKREVSSSSKDIRTSSCWPDFSLPFWFDRRRWCCRDTPTTPFVLQKTWRTFIWFSSTLWALLHRVIPEFQVISSRKFVNTLAPSVGTTWSRVPVNTRILGIFYGKYAVNSKKYG
jgi:hypothetical protein